MLKFLLDRILPKERTVRVELPSLVGSPDAVEVLAALIEAASTGQISPSEAAALASPVAAYARIVNDAELEERLEKIEKMLRETKFEELQWLKDYDTALRKLRGASLNSS